MGIFQEHKLNKIIKKSVDATLLQIENDSPRIFKHCYYGAFWVSPGSLVIWYIFKTDAEWEEAKENGLTNQLKLLTFHNLMSFGYPLMAIPSKFIPENKRDKESSRGKKVFVAFTSDEDVQNKAGGDYHVYFN